MAQNLQEKFNLTTDQMEELKAAFAIFDKNSDGKINAKELMTILKNLGQDPTEQEVQDIINDADDNGDGELQFEEFLGLMVKQGASASSEQDDTADLRAAFEVFDTNGDGQISKEELAQVMKNVGETLSDEEISNMFKEADTDGNGSIDYKEFMAMMRRG